MRGFGHACCTVVAAENNRDAIGKLSIHEQPIHQQKLVWEKITEMEAEAHTSGGKSDQVLQFFKE